MSYLLRGTTLNVEKCIDYLRSVGVEVSDELAQSWRDTEQVDRLCEHMKKPGQTAYLWQCAKGHLSLHVRKRGAHRKGSGDKCAKCGARLVRGRLWWIITVDGTLKDYRPKDERWRQLEDVGSL